MIPRKSWDAARAAHLLTRDEARRIAANIAVAAGSGLRPIRSLPLILLFTLGNIHILDASGFKLTRVRLLLAKPTKYQAET